MKKIFIAIWRFFSPLKERKVVVEDIRKYPMTPDKCHKNTLVLKEEKKDFIKTATDKAEKIYFEKSADLALEGDKPQYSGKGILEQISEKKTYSKLSTEKMDEVFKEAVNEMAKPKKKRKYYPKKKKD